MAKGKGISLNLKDPTLDRWYHNVARGAEITADVYMRRLNFFCQWANKDPSDLPKMSEEDLFNLILDFITHEEQRGKAGSYIESTVKAVKSWLHHNGIHMARKIKIHGATQTPTLANERVPTQEELKKIFLSSTSRDRVCCALMAHSGLRPEVLGNYKGTDGLRIRDFPEMKIEGQMVEFTKRPTIVIIRPELSKTTLRYFAFLSEEGCDYLKVYLEERLRSGEKFDADTDIITGRNTDKKFIRSINVGDAVRSSLKGAGFQVRPYVLRAFCDTQLLLAESRGKMIHSYRQFLMGHKGDIEARYTTNKGKLPEDLIEDIRESYRKSQEFLQTIVSSSEQEDKFNLTFKKRFLSLAGTTPEEINKMDLDSMSDAEIMDQFKKRIGNGSGNHSNNNARQKIVAMSDLERFIEDGWEYVNALPDGKVIIRSHNII